MPRIDHFVAGRKNRDARPIVHINPDGSDGGERADAARVHHLACRDDDLSGLNVGAPAADVLLRLHLGEDPHDVVCIGVGLLDHHDRVGAVGYRRAGGNFDALAIAYRYRRHLAGVERPDFRQRPRSRSRRALRIARPHGIAIHARARKRRHVESARRRRCASTRPFASLEHDRFDVRDRRAGAVEDRARGLERNHIAERPHAGVRHVQRDSSRTRCPSSGSSSLFMPRRTAFSDPGSETMIFPCAVPAHARLIIADGPISW